MSKALAMAYDCDVFARAVFRPDGWEARIEDAHGNVLINWGPQPTAERACLLALKMAYTDQLRDAIEGYVSSEEWYAQRMQEVATEELLALSWEPEQKNLFGNIK